MSCSTIQEELFVQYPSCKEQLKVLPEVKSQLEADIFADSLLYKNQSVATVLQNFSLNGLMIQHSQQQMASFYIPAPKLDVLVPILHVDENSSQNMSAVCAAFEKFATVMSQFAEYFLFFVMKEKQLESYACFQQRIDGSKFRIDYNLGKNKFSMSKSAQICDIENASSVSIGGNASMILQKYVEHIQKKSQLKLNNQQGQKFLFQIVRLAEQISQGQHIDQLMIEQRVSESQAAFTYFFRNFRNELTTIKPRFFVDEAKKDFFGKIISTAKLNDGLLFADWVEYMNRSSIVQFFEGFNTVLHMNQKLITFMVQVPDLLEPIPKMMNLFIAFIHCVTLLLPAVRLYISVVILASLKRKYPMMQDLFEKITAKDISKMMQVDLLLPASVTELKGAELRQMLDFQSRFNPNCEEKVLNDLQSDETDSISCIQILLEKGTRYRINHDLQLKRIKADQDFQLQHNEAFGYIYSAMALSYIHSETYSLQAETQFVPQFLYQDLQNILLTQLHTKTQTPFQTPNQFNFNQQEEPKKNLQILTRQLVHNLLSSQSYDDWEDILSMRFHKKEAIVFFIGETVLYLRNPMAFNVEEIIVQKMREVVIEKFIAASNQTNQVFLVNILESGLYQWFVEKVGFNSWKTLSKKMPSFLYAPCKQSDITTLRWTIAFLRQNQYLTEQMSEILFDGNNLMTLVCRSEKPDIELVRTLLENGFPVELLLAKVDNKSSMEWCLSQGLLEVGKLLAQKTSGLKAPKEVNKERIQTESMKLFANHQNQFATLLKDADSLCNKFGKDEAMLKRFHEITCKLRTHLELIQNNTTVDSQVVTANIFDESLQTIMICFKNVQTLHGFLSVKYAELEDSDSDEEVAFSRSENKYCVDLFGQLENRVSMIDGKLGLMDLDSP